jgi:hypothetical protein
MYSREHLETVDKDFGPKLQSTLQTLLQMITDGSPLTLAEEEFICGKMRSLRGGENGEYLHDVNSINACQNFRFRNTYLLYHLNLNGYKPAFDMYGQIPFDERMDDAKFLKNIHQSWKTVLAGPTDDKIVEHSQTEYRHQLKVLERYCKARGIGGFYRDYLMKSVVLHSKFIYYLVKEFYEELGQVNETVSIFGRDVVIDSFCYIHNMFRHYAEQSKEYQLGKTYHFDTNIDYKTIPSFLKDILEKLVSTADPSLFQNNSVHFIFKGSYYTIHVSPFGGTPRVATCFPVGRPNELAN